MKMTILAGILAVSMAAAAHAQSGYGYGYRGGYGGGYGGGYPAQSPGGYGWGYSNPGTSWGGSWSMPGVGGGYYGGFWGAGGWGYGWPGYYGGWGYGGLYLGGGPDGYYWFGDTPDYFGPRTYFPGVNPAPERKTEEKKKAEPPLRVRARPALEEGRALFAKGDGPGALEAFRAALLRDVEDLAAQAWFGLALAMTGDARNARKALRMAAPGLGRLDFTEAERKRVTAIPSDVLAEFSSLARND
jgi:hypothetical protein